MVDQSINQKVAIAAAFLRSCQNPADSGWGLNVILEDTYQTSNIVNTTEAIYSINRGGITDDIKDKVYRFYRYAIRTHPIERGDRIRYYIYTLWGLMELGYTRENEFVNKMIKELEQRYIENFGWKNRKEDEQINLFSTFWSICVLQIAMGRDNTFDRYKGCIEKIIDGGRTKGFRWGLPNQEGDSLAATSYAMILLSLFYANDPCLPKVKENLLTLTEQALDTGYLMEMEKIPGTNWYHYSYCWALKALHSYAGPIDPATEQITIRLLDFINKLYIDGRGFRDYQQEICNVPSIFNNIFAIEAVKQNPSTKNCPNLVAIFR